MLCDSRLEGCTVRLSSQRRNLRDLVVEAIREPDEIRWSIRDRHVLVFHKRWQLRWLSAVVRTTATDGFLVTAYPADKIKAGELVWTK